MNEKRVSDQLAGVIHHVEKRSPTNYHQSVSSLYRETAGGELEPFLDLYTDPFMPNIPTQIQVNPSRFGSFEEMSQILSKVDNLEHLEVARIDHCVDVEIPIETIFQGASWTRKRLREKYSQGSMTGFYFGKHPEVLCVYDKARKEKLDGVLTRLELRQYQKKVPVKDYLRLPELVHHEPFKIIKFQRVKDMDQGLLRGTGEFKISLLKRWLQLYGFQGAFKKLNPNSNFNRDFGHFIETDPAQPRLDEIYQNNLRQYFGGGQIGNTGTN